MISKVSNDILDLSSNIDSAIIEYLKFVSAIGIVCHNTCWIEGDESWGADMISVTTRLMSERVNPEFENILDYFLRHVNSNLGYIADTDYSRDIGRRTIGRLDFSTSEPTSFLELSTIIKDAIGKEKLDYIKSDLLEKIKKHPEYANIQSTDIDNLHLFLRNFKIILDDIFKGSKYPEEISDYLDKYFPECDEVEDSFNELKEMIYDI